MTAKGIARPHGHIVSGRVVSVTSYDAVTGRAVVDVFGVPITNVLNATGEQLRSGWVVWAERRGEALTADWVITGVYNPPGRAFKAKISTTNVQSPTAGAVTKVDFTSGNGGIINYNYGMIVDLANSRITIPTSGVYRYGVGVSWGANASGGSAVFLDIKLNNTIFLPPRFTGRFDAITGAATVDDEREFAVNDFVEFFITSTAQTRTFGTATDELGARLWISYVP